MMSFIHLQILLLMILSYSLANGISLKKNNRYDYEMISADDKKADILSDEEENLYYNSIGDDEHEMSTEQPIVHSHEQNHGTSPNNLRDVMLEVLRTSNFSNNDQCQKYKSQINDLCMMKFLQRSRLRGPFGDESDMMTLDLDSIASPQQICCEFRLTYLRCILSNINLVCPPTEFTSMFNQVSGISEICHNFFKSSRKCRRRYTIAIGFISPQTHTINPISV